jgi:hypothetical protein
MSKKQKRRVSQSQSVAQSVSSSASPTTTPSVATPVRTRSTIFEFKPDYTYIFRDLKRIGILAGSFFVILVVLSFFLR